MSEHNTIINKNYGIISVIDLFILFDESECCCNLH